MSDKHKFLALLVLSIGFLAIGLPISANEETSFPTNTPSIDSKLYQPWNSATSSTGDPAILRSIDPAPIAVGDFDTTLGKQRPYRYNFDANFYKVLDSQHHEIFVRRNTDNRPADFFNSPRFTDAKPTPAPHEVGGSH